MFVFLKLYSTSKPELVQEQILQNTQNKTHLSDILPFYKICFM